MSDECECMVTRRVGDESKEVGCKQYEGPTFHNVEFAGPS